MSVSARRISPPSEADLEAILSLEDIREHCRIDGGFEDKSLKLWRVAAVDHVEQTTGVILTPQLWRLTARLPFEEFPLFRVSSVERILIRRPGGAEEELAEDLWRFAADLDRPRLIAGWPSLAAAEPDAVRIEVLAGYAATEVPEGLRQALRMLIAHWHRNREAVGPGVMVSMPLGFGTLIGPHRRGVVA